MTERVPVDKLVYRADLHVRDSISSSHVRAMAHARDGGHAFRPITADRTRLIISDGIHRWEEATRRGETDIEVNLVDYGSDAEIFRASGLLNPPALSLSTYDHLRVIERGTELGLRENDLAAMMYTSISHLRAIMPRYATVAQAVEDAPNLRRLSPSTPSQRVPLKASVRHLSGQVITEKQADEIRGAAPGSSYLLIVRQLIGGLENDLLPPPDQHPALWVAIDKLADLLTSSSGTRKAA